jgi:hypothetical protein
VFGTLLGLFAQWLGSAALLAVLGIAALGAFFSARRLPEVE